MGELEVKLGALLRLERERQNVKLEDLAENLRISESSLECIECGDASALPSEIYFSLFAKSYSEAIGIDYSATVQAIKEDIEEHPQEPNTQQETPKQDAEDTNITEELPPETHSSWLKISKSTTRRLLWIGAALVLIIGGYFVVKQLLKEMKLEIDSSAETNETVDE
ncbi:MAG: hypothetical protein DRP47_10470, partial [Candidatus Zixiibacteriota bacterium]